MSEKPTHIPDTAVCFWRKGDTWLCAFKDFAPGDPIGVGTTFDVALEVLEAQRHKQPPRSKSYSDLRLIDELLIDLMLTYAKRPADMFERSSISRAAMERLRAAWKAGEPMTAAWAVFFDTNP